MRHLGQLIPLLGDEQGYLIRFVLLQRILGGFLIFQQRLPRQPYILLGLLVAIAVRRESIFGHAVPVLDLRLYERIEERHHAQVFLRRLIAVVVGYSLWSKSKELEQQIEKICRYLPVC